MGVYFVMLGSVAASKNIDIKHRDLTRQWVSVYTPMVTIALCNTFLPIITYNTTMYVGRVINTVRYKLLLPVLTKRKHCIMINF